jgi:hypothetical protein
MFNRLDKFTNVSEVSLEVSKFFTEAKNFENNIRKKLSLFCKLDLSDTARERIVDMVDEKTRRYFGLGVDIIRANGCSLSELDKIISDSLKGDYSGHIYQKFKEGDKISKVEIKSKLQNLYKSLKLNKTAKASDLEKYFELKSCKVKNSQTGKWEHGFELVTRKSL